MSKEKNDLLFEKLDDYFQDVDKFSIFKTTTNGRSCISLRLLDFFITSYAKQHDICYTMQNEPFHVYNNYKSQLKAYSKKHLDPFCRRDRTTLTNRTVHDSVTTTIGQMNLFRWVIESRILEFITEHILEIEASMKSEANTQSKRTRKRLTCEPPLLQREPAEIERIFVVNF